MYDDDWRIRQQLNNNLSAEYNEETDTIDIVNSDGKTIEKNERTDFDNVIETQIHNVNQKNVNIGKTKEIHLVDEQRQINEYYQKVKDLNEQQLDEERKRIILERFDLGDDLNGNNLAFRDLELALITGRDLDGFDIPYDTPEERRAEENKEKENEKNEEISK